jgi:hypothetical protein
MELAPAQVMALPATPKQQLIAQLPALTAALYAPVPVQFGDALVLQAFTHQKHFVVGEPFKVGLSWRSPLTRTTNYLAAMRLYVGGRGLIAEHVAPIHFNATNAAAAIDQSFDLYFTDMNKLWYARAPLVLELRVSDADTRKLLGVRPVHSRNKRGYASYILAALNKDQLEANACSADDVLAQAVAQQLVLPAQGQFYTGFWFGHHGIDIADRLGAPIRAAADGVVDDMTGWNNQGYGLLAKIRHADVRTNATQTHTLTTLYAHMGRLLVRRGQHVKAGQTIGHMGSTGRSSGPHLHFEVRLGDVPQNPYCFFAR